MEYRKLIKFGTSSHVISVPNNWLKKNNLNKGDVIYLKENGSNELVLMPEKKEVKEEIKQAVIDGTNKNIDLIMREITSAYINNYRIIKITGKGVNKKAKKIREILNSYVGLEIIEQTDNCIIAKDFINIKDVLVDNLLRRMDILTRTMINDSKLYGKKNLYENVLQRDGDVNKLSYLAQRKIKIHIDSPECTNSAEFLKLWEVIRLIENIGDEPKRISRWLKEISFSKEEEKSFFEVYSDIERFYLEVMNAYFKKDIKQAFALILRKVELIAKTRAFLDKNYKKKGLANVVEKLNSIIVNTHIINKMTVN